MERLEKLTRFRTIIQGEVSERCREIDEELQDYRSQELTRAEDTILKESYALIQKEVADISAQTTKTVSRMRVEMKRKLYERRDGYVTQIFAEARARLQAFAASPEYRVFLLEKTRRLGEIGADGTTLCVRREDLALEAELRLAYGHRCEVKASPAVRLGGVVAENQASASIADESLDSILEAQRAWLCAQPAFVVTL